MSKAQIKKLVTTASAEELEEHIWFLQLTIMELTEWVQSNYPAVKLPKEFKRKYLL